MCLCMQELRGLCLALVKPSLPSAWPTVYLRKLSDDEQIMADWFGFVQYEIAMECNRLKLYRFFH